MARPRIVLLDEKDLDGVVSIHCSELPQDLLVKVFGGGFLRECYYRELLSSPSSFILGVKSKKEIVGFAAFLGSPGLVGSVAKKNVGRLIAASCRNALNPGFLRDLGSAVFLSFLRSKKKVEDGMELNYIAISKAYQGNGLGARLIREGERIAGKGKGSGFLWVKTLKSTPQNVRFYEKLGFRSYDESVGRVFLSKKMASGSK